MFTSVATLPPARDPAVVRASRNSPDRGRDGVSITLSQQALAVAAALTIDARTAELAKALAHAPAARDRAAGGEAMPDTQQRCMADEAQSSVDSMRRNIRNGHEIVRRYQAAVEAGTTAGAPSSANRSIPQKGSFRSGSEAYIRMLAGSLERNARACDEAAPAGLNA